MTDTTRTELRKALLEFDKSRGLTGADYVSGKITRQQADSEFEDDITRVLDLFDQALVSEVTEARIDELEGVNPFTAYTYEDGTGATVVKRVQQLRYQLRQKGQA